MEAELLEEIKRELINGYVKKRHPFRYFTLATVNDGRPRQRTVVLRQVLSDFTLVFFTDERSQKVHDIKNKQDVSALFYHPKKLMQVRLEGVAERIEDQDQLDNYWRKISETSRKDYITQDAPGSPIKNPSVVSYNENQPNFCIFKIVPSTIEYLQLKRPNHLRILYSKNEDNWEGQFLVP